MSIYIEAAEQVGELAWRHRHKLTRVATELFDRIRSRQIRVLVFGAPGVGKSTIGKLLAGKLTEEELLRDYQKSFRVEPEKLKASMFGELLVAPGDRIFRHTWGELKSQIRIGKINVIINVVAFGYHSFSADEPWRSDGSFARGMQKAEFLDTYLEVRRKEEVAQLMELKDVLSDSPNRVWFLTFVSKQDLWWHNRRAVSEYYEAGPYAGAVADIHKIKPERDLPHTIVSGSLTWKNLRDGRGELLFPTAEGFDLLLRRAHLSRFAFVLDQVLGRRT